MSGPVTVLVLTPSIGGFYFGELIAGLSTEVNAAGGRVVLVQTLDGGMRNSEATEPSDFATPVAWSEVDGVVSITTAVRGAYLQRLRDAGKPVVLVSTRVPDFAAPLALPDNHGGTYAAVEHLIGHGHTRIGFVGNFDQHDVRDRHAAYVQALDSHDLAADAALVFSAPNNEWTGGVEAARAVLAAPDRPTALMVATDRNAIGLMGALTDAGLTLPRDMAVIGFDNVEAAAFSSPSLTSVNQRFDEVGALGARLLLAQLRGETVSFTPHSLPTALMQLRGSCGCATDAHGTATVGRAATANAAVLRDELEETLCRALLTGRRSVDNDLREATRRTVGEVERLVYSGVEIATTEIQSLTASLHGLTSRSDILRRISRAVIEYIQRAAPPTAGELASEMTAVGRGRLITALWQLQAGAFLRQSESTLIALEEQYTVNAGMVDAGHADPRQLGWLGGTHVRAGILALWEDGPQSGQLRIAGQYDPEGLIAELGGAAVTPEQFPPAMLIDAAQTHDRGVCVVVPVCTPNRDWGLLAVIGEIDTSSTLETYHRWATQLCACLEEEDLQEAVRASEERYARAARATNDGLWEFDVQSTNFYLSERCCELLDLEPEPASDRIARWEALVHPDDVDEMRDAILSVVGGSRETVNSEYRVRKVDGSYKWVLARAIGVRASDGTVERVVGSLSDVHERRSLEDRLRESALYDALTGLPNRRLFLTQLDYAIELWQRSKTPFAVIFLDLDGFKAINDSLGHQMGDRVLNEIGARLEHELRGVDTGARFGGDEFAILLHDVAADGVLTVAWRIQASLTKVIYLDGHEFAIGASLGVATSAIEYTSAEDVLRDADTAMYHAKDTERGTVSFFDVAMHADALRELQVNAEIRRALDEHQFEVRYQPIVNLVTGRTDRFEALVRWRHPDRGIILPDDFVPQMGEIGLIVGLGQWIIDTVCAQLAAWGPSVANVAVNVSDREFWHSDLLPTVLGSLARHNLTADRLTLEITEGVIMHRPQVALQLMQGMHDAGLTLHIDDFGTGYSSLETLHRFPVDAFKIDRSFIANLTDGERTGELVRAIIAMGNALGLAVVAEGVETAEQLASLQEMGCAAAQGFLFMPAVSGEHALGLLGRVLSPHQLDVAASHTGSGGTSVARTPGADHSEPRDSSVAM